MSHLFDMTVEEFTVMHAQSTMMMTKLGYVYNIDKKEWEAPAHVEKPDNISTSLAAVQTLRRLGYNYNGGEEWRPPLGEKPDLDLLEQKGIEIDKLRKECQDKEREIATLQADRDAWKREYELFKNAWIRSLGGKIYNKRHLIDALVMTTEKINKQANEREKGHSTAVIEWITAEKARVLATIAYYERRAHCRDAGMAEPSIDNGSHVEWRAKDSAENVERIARMEMSDHLNCQPPEPSGPGWAGKL